MKDVFSTDFLRYEWLWMVVLLCFVAGAVSVILFVGYAPPTEHVWSNVILLDTGWRYSQGLVPHFDTHSSFGFVFHAFAGWSMQLFGTHPDAIAYLPLLVMPLIVPWCWMVGRDRLPPWLNAGFGAMVVAHLLAISMFGSESSQGITYAGQYNRLCWAMIMPLLLFLAVPQVMRGGPGFRYGMLTAAGLWAGLLFGIKFTTVGAVAGAMVCGVMVRYFHGHPALIKNTIIDAVVIAIAAMITLIGFAFLTGSSIFAYLADLGMLASGTQDSLLKLLFLAVRETRSMPVVLWLLTLYLCVCIRPWSWRNTGGAILVGLASCGAGFLLSATNGAELASPCYLLSSWILLSYVLQPAKRLLHQQVTDNLDQSQYSLLGSWRSPTFLQVAILLVVGFSAAAIGSLARPVMNVAWAHVRIGPWQPSWGLATENMSQAWMTLSGQLPATEAELDSALSPTPETYKASQYALRLQAGVALIGDQPNPDMKITTLDFVNPFPFVLGTASIAGDILYWHDGRNVSSGMDFSAASVLNQADIIMEPKRPIIPGTLQLKKTMFAEGFPADFYREGENDWWIIWRRKDR